MDDASFQVSKFQLVPSCFFSLERAQGFLLPPSLIKKPSKRKGLSTLPLWESFCLVQPKRLSRVSAISSPFPILLHEKYFSEVEFLFIVWLGLEVAEQFLQRNGDADQGPYGVIATEACLFRKHRCSSS